MSEFENRIFDTLTLSEEKFKSAVEIANHLKGVKRKLLKQFWKNVEKELKELVKISEEDLKVVLDPNIFLHTSKCYLYYGNNPSVRIVYEVLNGKQRFGIWFVDKNINFEKIRNYNNQVKNQFDGYHFNHWWFAKKHTQDDFTTLDSLMMILPGNMSEYSKLKAKELFDFAVTNKEHTKYIINNCLN